MNYERLEKFEKHRQQLLAKHAGDGVILDIGYANQPNSFLRGREVIGVDLHAAECPANYARVVEADALSLPFEPNSVDAIVAGELVEHLMNPTQYFLECNRILKPGGRCIFSVPNPYHLPELFKNILLSRRELFTNSHLSATAFRTMVKLLMMTGFDVADIEGDYLRVPKVHWLIPMHRVPGIAYSNLYVATKEREVELNDFHSRLHTIHASEAAAAEVRNSAFSLLR